MLDVERILLGRLQGCQPLVDFAGEAKLSRGTPVMQLDVHGGEAYVNLYLAGDSGVVVVGYSEERDEKDTAYCGDAEAAYDAALTIEQYECVEVLRDETSYMTIGTVSE